MEGKWEGRVAHRLKRDTKENMQQRRQYKEIKITCQRLQGCFTAMQRCTTAHPHPCMRTDITTLLYKEGRSCIADRSMPFFKYGIYSSAHPTKIFWREQDSNRHCLRRFDLVVFYVIHFLNTNLSL